IAAVEKAFRVIDGCEVGGAEAIEISASARIRESEQGLESVAGRIPPHIAQKSAVRLPRKIVQLNDAGNYRSESSGNLRIAGIRDVASTAYGIVLDRCEKGLPNLRGVSAELHDVAAGRHAHIVKAL